MTFRRATLADVAIVTQLTRAAYTPWIAVIGREPMPLLVDYAEAILLHHIDILDQPNPIALIEMVPMPDHLWLENLAVHPDHQGRGHGHQLLAHATANALSLNLPELRLLTNAAFTANLRFYAKQGFVQTDLQPFKDGHIAYFRKTLPET